MQHRFCRVYTVRAVGRGALADTMEVLIEGYVLSAEPEEHTDVTFWKMLSEGDERAFEDVRV